MARPAETRLTNPQFSIYFRYWLWYNRGNYKKEASMTNEEAMLTLKVVEEYFDKNVPMLGGEAMRMAIDALRVQQTPTNLDRSQWKGCETCKGGRYRRGEYCPGCGRPLTEEAWVALERRTNDGTAD